MPVNRAADASRNEEAWSTRDSGSTSSSPAQKASGVRRPVSEQRLGIEAQSSPPATCLRLQALSPSELSRSRTTGFPNQGRVIHGVKVRYLIKPMQSELWRVAHRIVSEEKWV